MTKEARYSEIATMCRNLWLKKNEAYGNNMSKNFKKYGQVVYVLRLSDKLGRLITIDNNPDIKTNDESIVDTIVDSICYCIMCVGDIAARNTSGQSDNINIGFTDTVFKDFINSPNIVEENLYGEGVLTYKQMLGILDEAYSSESELELSETCTFLAAALIRHYNTLSEIEEAIYRGN